MRKSKQPPISEERKQLLRSLDETCRDLDAAHANFNAAVDPDLIEFYLYEIDALRARHTYLLRRVKTLTDAPLPLYTQRPTPPI